MTPMCSSITGSQVGWTVGTVDCDGSTVSIEYFNTSGVSQGTTLPANWQPCIQGEIGPAWSPTLDIIPYAATVNIDFDDAEYISINDVSGNLTLTGSNYNAPRELVVRLVESGGASRTLTFPASWKFLGAAAPASLAANKTGILRLIGFDSNATGVMAIWTVQP